MANWGRASWPTGGERVGQLAHPHWITETPGRAPVRRIGWTHRPGLRPYCTCCAWREHPATHTADYNRAGALELATFPLYLASQAVTAVGAAAKRSCIGTPSCAFRAFVAASALRMHSQPLLKPNGAAASAPKKKAKKAKPAAKKRTTTTRYPSPPTEHSSLEFAWWRLLNAGMRLSHNPRCKART